MMKTRNSVRPRAGQMLSGLALLALLSQGALAQSDEAQAETVTWTASVRPAATPASPLALTLHAQVRDGWHVYALKQLPGGPTPLRVTLDPNSVATAAGDPVGTPPTKVHDRGFDLETQFYSHAFSVTVPLRIGAASSGAQLPVSVRFQTCNDRICQPPKTVHLSAPISLAAK
jgi:DsbC/DsbD-like thiol-disulfide interchange protein